MIRLPQRGNWSRWLALAAGAAVFLWLRLEDTQLWPAALLGVVTSGTAAWLWLLDARRLGGKIFPASAALVGALVLGAGIGLGSVLGTVLLMFFKNATHAHLYFDYPPEVLGAMLARAPVWMLVGALAAGGLVLLWLALKFEEPTRRG